MADYLSLEEAAQKLGIPTDKLVELRSQGQVRGFRDGASWKFPETEIDRLADDPDLAAALADPGSSGSGLLVDSDLGSSLSGGSSVIGADAAAADGEGSGSGSDLEIGDETLQPTGGSDVNLIASEGEGSDVAIVASDDSDIMLEGGGGGLLEIDSSDLQLDQPAITHPSEKVDLAIEPNAGSTGPVTDAELKEISESHPDVLSPEADHGGEGSTGGGSSSGGSLDIGAEPDDIPLNNESDLSFSGIGPDEDSGDEIIGMDEDSGMDVLGSDIGSGVGSGTGSQVSSGGASNLELMGGDLDEPADADLQGSRGADVLSELDLLSAEQGSSLVTGDSENLLKSSGLGSSIGADGFKDSDLAGLDDALADDDELVIADDDDDLVISSAGSDISVAGDSGINLMSPSDSGLSLESEPLDLAGSSISALDLGAELSDGGSGSGVGSGSGSDGSLVDFQADEDFQLSPSGIDADGESGSQVIEVEDSEAIGEPVEFGEVGADAGLGGEGMFEAAEPGEALVEESEGIDIDQSAAAAGASQPAPVSAYEVPFSLMQCVTLMLILCILSLGGMLMTDLVRNMWAYSEPTAPVSSLTDSLVSLMGWGQ